MYVSVCVCECVCMCVCVCQCVYGRVRGNVFVCVWCMSVCVFSLEFVSLCGCGKCSFTLATVPDATLYLLLVPCHSPNFMLRCCQSTHTHMHTHTHTHTHISTHKHIHTRFVTAVIYDLKVACCSHALCSLFPCCCKRFRCEPGPCVRAPDAGRWREMETSLSPPYPPAGVHTVTVWMCIS